MGEATVTRIIYDDEAKVWVAIRNDGVVTEAETYQRLLKKIQTMEREIPEDK